MKLRTAAFYHWNYGLWPLQGIGGCGHWARGSGAKLGRYDGVSLCRQAHQALYANALIFRPYGCVLKDSQQKFGAQAQGTGTEVYQGAH